LWECWVLEGLEGGRFALLLKTHHCMIDEADADLLQVLLTADPEAEMPEAPLYTPRPPPSVRELVIDEVVQQARLPRRLFERVRGLVTERDRLARELKAQATTAAGILGYTLRPPMETPLNGRVGHHRRFKGVAVSLEEARRVRRALDGRMLDVILATVAGAVRSYFQERLVSPAAVDFRVGTPVGLAEGRSGQRTTEWIIDLPLWEKDALARFERIREKTREYGLGPGAVPASSLMEGDVWYGGRLLALGARSLASHSPINMTVINAPGAQVPLYLAGARMREAYGQVPLRGHLGLGVAVTSYDGALFFGVNADFDLVPDLDLFAAGLEPSFDELRRVAGPAEAAASG
jgi:WS/DGAT/MGAT family acyltransferase